MSRSQIRLVHDAPSHIHPAAIPIVTKIDPSLEFGRERRVVRLIGAGRLSLTTTTAAARARLLHLSTRVEDSWLVHAASASDHTRIKLFANRKAAKMLLEAERPRAAESRRLQTHPHPYENHKL